MENKVKISKEEAIRFYSHLSDEQNIRIIFSSPFGVGKTTFLKELSKQESIDSLSSNQNFNFYHIYPVNYSVASNEDIFQYIKYDLIYLLINKGIQFEKNDFDFLKTLSKYFKENAHKLVAKLFLTVPHVGKDLLNIFEELDKIKDEIIEACEQSVADEGEKFYNYLLELENKAGSIYELDIYSKIIQNIIIRESNNNSKKNVLVIDDLDRIDPNHIFRLLNVFSAHFDTYENGNKFGFDKIVFVCDLNNIRKIFSNLYGQDVDFNGYIDKFYSTTVFKFGNYESLRMSLDLKLKGAKKSLIFFNEVDKSFIITLLQILIFNDKLNYRSVLKVEMSDIEKELERVQYSNFWKCHLVKISFFLKDVFGNYESLIRIVDEMVSLNENDKIINKNILDINSYYNRYIIPVLFYEVHNWTVDRDFDVINKQSRVRFTLKDDTKSFIYVEPKDSVYPFAKISFWIDLKKSIEILHQQNIL